jgi:hypothetical protein
MSRNVVVVPKTEQQQFEFVSHGRGGPGGRTHLSAEQIAQVARTVRRVPEVVVKVSGGGREVGAVKAHLAYIDRHGKLDLQTDEGRALTGRDAAAEIVQDWNLDLSTGQYRTGSSRAGVDRRPKMVHNIVLSMPGRTPGAAVLAAARQFAREHFALQYRYAMVLHTDQAHPHVHLVVKTEHETNPRQRLHIRKATLRQWREDFARALREQGIAANATPGAVRGIAPIRKKDPILQRLKTVADYERLPTDVKEQRPPPATSTFMTAKVKAVAEELRSGTFKPDAGRARLSRTREEVSAGWRETALQLRNQGEEQLAAEVDQFVNSMEPVRTERESIASGLLAQVRAARRSKREDGPEVHGK